MQYHLHKMILHVRFLPYVQGVYIIVVTTTILHSPLFSVYLANMFLLYKNKLFIQYVTENVTAFVIFGNGIFQHLIIK